MDENNNKIQPKDEKLFVKCLEGLADQYISERKIKGRITKYKFNGSMPKKKIWEKFKSSSEYEPLRNKAISELKDEVLKYAKPENRKGNSIYTIYVHDFYQYYDYIVNDIAKNIPLDPERYEKKLRQKRREQINEIENDVNIEELWTKVSEQYEEDWKHELQKKIESALMLKQLKIYRTDYTSNYYFFERKYDTESLSEDNINEFLQMFDMCDYGWGDEGDAFLSDLANLDDSGLGFQGAVENFLTGKFEDIVKKQVKEIHPKAEDDIIDEAFFGDAMDCVVENDECKDNIILYLTKTFNSENI